MKYFAWNDEKNATLIQERGISFEEIVFHIESGDVLDLLVVAVVVVMLRLTRACVSLWIKRLLPI